MAEVATSRYERHWNAREYLRQYYSTEVTADDVANTRFAARELRKLGRRFERALEFGCGPTAHHAAPLVPHVEHFTLADFLPANLAEVREWLADAPGAFDWDMWLSGLLAVEAECHGMAVDSLVERKRLMRRVVSSLVCGDILRPLPAMHRARYDLVTSYYCLECATSDRVEWLACLARLCQAVRPGGVLILGALRRARAYRVFDQEFPATSIDEADFARELPRLGFPASGLRIEAESVPEFAAQGFDGVCCVRAVKAAVRTRVPERSRA